MHNVTAVGGVYRESFVALRHIEIGLATEYYIALLLVEVLALYQS